MADTVKTWFQEFAKISRSEALLFWSKHNTFGKTDLLWRHGSLFTFYFYLYPRNFNHSWSLHVASPSFFYR